MPKDHVNPQKPHSKTPLVRAKAVTTPETLGASILNICHGLDRGAVHELVDELTRQSAAVREGDMSRVESMLLTQAHTLDGLFAKLAAHALQATTLDALEQFMKLALRAQSQARATLQTLAEVKMPKQLAFVHQANIGNQVQVNNGANGDSARASENKKTQNELLEAQNGERLDTRKAGAAGGADSSMATVAEESWSYYPYR